MRSATQGAADCLKSAAVPDLRVGVLGGTGPAGKALATRLASVGVEVSIGSASRSEPAMPAKS